MYSPLVNIAFKCDGSVGMGAINRPLQQGDDKSTPNVPAISRDAILHEVFKYWSVVSYKQSEGRAYHPELQRRISRLAQRIAQGKWHKKRPRQTNLLRNLSQERERDGRDARVFNGTLDQPHGLIAHWSDRCEQDYIDAIGG